jgi:hypothetical protein
VNLHGLEVTLVGTANGPPIGTDEDGYLEGMIEAASYRAGEMVLTPVERLPRLCHVGETIRFKVGNRPINEGLLELRAAVYYAFGNGPVRTREVRWRRKIDDRRVRRIIHD